MPSDEYFLATQNEHMSMKWSACRWLSATASIWCTAAYRCSGPSAPLPRSTTSRKPSASSR